MDLIIKKANDEGSCNFCNRLDIHTFTYPYKKVFALRGNVIAVRFCEDCMNELISKFQKLEGK